MITTPCEYKKMLFLWIIIWLPTVFSPVNDGDTLITEDQAECWQGRELVFELWCSPRLHGHTVRNHFSESECELTALTAFCIIFKERLGNTRLWQYIYVHLAKYRSKDLSQSMIYIWDPCEHVFGFTCISMVCVFKGTHVLIPFDGVFAVAAFT